MTMCDMCYNSVAFRYGETGYSVARRRRARILSCNMYIFRYTRAAIGLYQPASCFWILAINIAVRDFIIKLVLLPFPGPGEKKVGYTTYPIFFIIDWYKIVSKKFVFFW